MPNDPIWMKEVQCKACDAKFKTPRIKSSFLKAKSIDSDFHKVYENLNPLYYAVTACPECNYAARDEDFDKQGLEYYPEVINIALAIKKSGKNIKFANARETTPEEAINKHLIAISFYRHFKPENPNTIAGLYMHIVWMYREMGNETKEKEYMQHALEYYIKTFEKGSFIPEKIGEPGIIYIIGEMNRRLGNYPEAVKWFSRAVKHAQIGMFANIEHLTRDAWEKITEEKRKGQNSQLETGGQA